MSITVANLMAQVGADVSQFKRGMDEVDARIKLSEMRGAASARRVGELQNASMRYREQAGHATARRDELNQNLPNLQQRQVQAQTRVQELQQRAALEAASHANALQKYQLAQAVGGGTANDAAVKALSRANKARDSYQKSVQSAENAEIMAQNRINSALLRRTELEARIAELQRKSQVAAAEALATEDTRAQAALVMEKYAKRREQDAREHIIRAGNAMSATAMKAGGAGLVGLGGADVAGNQINQMLLTVAHNTSLSDDGIKKMIATVKRLGEQSGLSLDEIAQGYRKLENYGFGAADSEKLLNQAMKVSVAQGTDMSATTETLTRVMKEYNIPIKDGVKAMNVLVATSKLSARNMTELDEVYGRMSATASNFGVSMLDTSAAFITFTRHGLDAHDAMTQFVNIINKIQNPSKQVQQALRNIDAEAKKLGVTGVSLFNAFSPTGIRSLGVGGVFAMIKKAAEQVEKVPAADLDVKLFPQRRGQLGGAIAVGTGARDWAKAIEEVKKRAEDGTAIDRQYQESLEQVNQQLNRLKNIGMDAASSIGTALAPVIREAIQWVQELAGKFNSLSESQKTTIVNSIAYASAFLLVGGAVGKLIVGVYSLATAAAALNITMRSALIWAPTVAALIAFGVAAVIAAKSTYQLAHSDEDLTNQFKENIKTNVQTTSSAYENGQQIGQLVNQYKKMEEQAAQTHKPVQGMQQLLDRISQMAPELVSGFNSEGHAIGLIGAAADGASEKLARLASSARAAALAASQAQLPGAQLEQDVANAHVNDLSARLNMLQRRGSMVNLGSYQGKTDQQYRADQKAAAGVAEQLRAAEQQYKSASTKLQSLKGVADAVFHVPNNTTSAHKRSTDDLKKDVDIIADVYNKAKKAVVDFQAANAKGVKVPAGMAANMSQTRAQYDLLSKEYNARLKAIGDVNTDAMGLHRASSIPGADKLAGLYDKPKKPKKGRKSKESDYEKTLDEYRDSVESIRQAEYKMAHEGMGDKEVEARWNTISHGMVTVGGSSKELEGKFQDLTQAEVKAYVSMARLADVHETARDNFKKFGQVVSGVFGSVAAAFNDLNAHTREGEANWAEKIAEPLGEKLSVYDRVLRDITKDTELVAAKGMGWARSMAQQAQSNTIAAEGAKRYESALEEVNNVLQKTKDEADEGGKRSLSQSTMASLTKLNWLQKAMLAPIIAQADAQDKLNEKTKATTTLTTYLADEVKRSAAEAVKGVDPSVLKRTDFEKSAIDKYGIERYEKLDTGGKAGVDKQIADAYKTVAANDLEAESQKKIADIMQKVKDKSTELTQKLKVNTDGIEVNQEQWDKLTEAQKQNIQQTVALAQTKDKIKSFTDGIDQVFTKTLDDVHQHGFRNFFKDIVNGFNDMLFQLAENWLNSQFLKLITNAFGGSNMQQFFGGGTGAGGGGKGGGGISALIGGLIGGLLPASGAGTAALADATAGSLPAGMDFGAALGSIPGMASGGSVFGDRAYMVGEHGPELFTPSSQGRITPNHQLGGSTHVTVHIHANDPGSYRSSRQQIVQDMTSAVNAAHRR